MKLSLLVSFYILLNAIIIVSSYSRFLEYNYESSTFSIKENENNYKVEIREPTINCIRAPCKQEYIIDEITITDKEDIDNLKTLFDEVLNGKSGKIVDYYVLTSKQNEIIKNVFDRNNIFYKIKGLDQNNSNYEERGYYEYETQYITFITVAMGEKPSGGYSIDVQKIEMNGEGVTIYVNEKEPEEGVMETSVMTYPAVQIKFNFVTSNITVVNNETGEKFPLLEDSFLRISASCFNVGHFLLFLIFFIF